MKLVKLLSAATAVSESPLAAGRMNLEKPRQAAAALEVPQEAPQRSQVQLGAEEHQEFAQEVAQDGTGRPQQENLHNSWDPRSSPAESLPEPSAEDSSEQDLPMERGGGSFW